MRLYNTYCLKAGSTLAKVKPDTNVKFCGARKIREAFSNPHPKHLLFVYSLGTKELKNMETDIYGAQWILCAHSTLIFLVTAFTILSSPAGVPPGHLCEQTCGLGRDIQWVMPRDHSTKQSAIRVNAGTKSSHEIHSPLSAFRDIWPPICENNILLKYLSPVANLARWITQPGVGNYGPWAKSSPLSVLVNLAVLKHRNV